MVGGQRLHSQEPEAMLERSAQARLGQYFGCQRIAQSAQLRQQYLPKSSIMWRVCPIRYMVFGIQKVPERATEGYVVPINWHSATSCPTLRRILKMIH